MTAPTECSPPSPGGGGVYELNIVEPEVTRLQRSGPGTARAPGSATTWVENKSRAATVQPGGGTSHQITAAGSLRLTGHPVTVKKKWKLQQQPVTSGSIATC
ncbi:hypothetical protein C0Q70_14038 [Pomacea canaliculata]|uniref:Uncharacterized protein n=1 Tax=Pomacea canaliculata TaxID=400727 RepID=A0A2T7NYX1_POMCA|nr:hypothetical protein C0Q70_14038 [Pomacea canaliculata]